MEAAATGKRERKVSAKLAEAEEHAAAALLPPEVKKPKKKRSSPAPAAKSSKKLKSTTQTKKPAPKATKKASPVKYHVMVIMVHVDQSGNRTEFYIAPTAKVTKANLAKLAACHHGALNDNLEQFNEIKKIINKSFKLVDNMFYNKENPEPVAVNQHISEVYQMHFSDFEEEEYSEQKSADQVQDDGNMQQSDQDEEEEEEYNMYSMNDDQGFGGNNGFDELEADFPAY
mmetsp:Transcript_20027/g.39689  ORF Transcript_20027/g.39689 Transcript_20027/m.39689 type:complete len:229 (+) Transcript_20027:32-718(+)|eukprot:CAMPEP_0175161054 /NCGR_PEP_ID=MMETSP0087-20121206/24387_1 /TAXON_ID=136419 /ORGANISM="Unknown Unknown, Strain D1" /LENGTH=228 /DNA_ID=CAMNT_0016449417 /DNA_START=58 /DNA_END=744 /DNA_ORIENTATION=-